MARVKVHGMSALSRQGPAVDARSGALTAGTAVAPEQPAAPARILQAAADLLAERGVARFNLQEVAESAAVSKGLIHYHYHDKDTLLTRLVESLATAVVARQQEALAASASAPAHAVESLWAWLHGELRRGHLRVLVELAQEPGSLVRNATYAAARQRRTAAAEMIERLFALLDLRPRVPAALLSDLVVAFEDGLVLQTSVIPEQDPRVAFDIFWLALLSLAD